MRTPLTDPAGITLGFLLDSLETSAHDHDLSTRLLDVVRGTPGAVQVIFEGWFDPSSAQRFDSFPQLPPGTIRKAEDNPHLEMGRFVVDFQNRVPNALTACEHWAMTPAKHMARGPWLSAGDRARYRLPAEERAVYHGERDLYFCVAGRDVPLDDAEFLVRPKGPFQTGICTTCPHVPPWGSSVDDAFVDALVANLRHVFVPVFDTSGYLIWTPRD